MKIHRFMASRVAALAFANFAAAAPSSAERATGGITDVTTIQDEEGNARLLFRGTPSLDAENFAIRRAILTFEVQGESEERTLELWVHPLTSDWNPGTVTWTRGWSTPGGDIDSEVFSSATLELTRGAGPVSIDVSNVLKQTLEDKLPFHGFLVTVHPSAGKGLRTEDLARFTRLANAGLEVSWRRTPSAPLELQADAEGL